jgi:hypothetical protein
LWATIGAAEGGEVDDVALLGLHGRRLDVEDHELRPGAAERRRELGDRLRAGADERHPLRRPGARDELLLELDRLLELAVTPGDGVEHDRLGQDLGPGLDHHDRVTGAGHDEVELALVELARGRVGDELAVDPADADRADGAQERDAAHRERRRGAVHGQDVGVVLLVRRQDGQHDLDVVLVALREEGADRPVGEAHGQDGRLRRARLALDEAARDLARGVHPLLVVHGEREEVDPLAGLGRDGGGEHDGVAIPEHDRSVRLFGELARLHGQGLPADFGFNLDGQVVPPV